MDRPSQKILYGWWLPDPSLAVAGGSPLCILPGNASRVPGLGGLLNYKVLGPGEALTMEYPGGLIVEVSLPGDSGSGPASILWPCVDFAALILWLRPGSAPAYIQELPSLYGFPLVEARLSGQAFTGAGGGSLEEIVESTVWLAGVPSAGGSVALVVSRLPEGVTRFQVDGLTVVVDFGEFLGFSGMGGSLVQSFEAAYHPSGALVHARMVLPGGYPAPRPAKLLLFPVMGLRADASPPLPYSIDQSLMGFNGPIEAEISLTSYSGLNPDKPVLSVQELGPRGLSGYTVVLAAAALLIVGFAWRGARLG